MKISWIVCLWVATGVAYADPSPAEHAGPPPPHATRLASGAVWVTLVPGHGPHPDARDWVLHYGGSSRQGRDHYYLIKQSRANAVSSFVDATEMRPGEKRRYWIPASGVSPAHVEDIELAAVLGPRAPIGSPLFPPPSDAVPTPSGDRFVILGKGDTSGPGAALTDRVMFSLFARAGDGTVVDPQLESGMQVLGDVANAAVIDAIRAMSPGERRLIWSTRGGKPAWLQLTLYAIERRPQRRPPPDVARAPAAAKTAPGVQYVVLQPGSGEPASSADEVTLDYAVWSPTGRTIESSAGVPIAHTAGSHVPALARQLVEMRTGERRRIWISAAEAGYLSEQGLGAVVEVTLVSIQRRVDVLPRGLQIVQRDDQLEVARGATRAALMTQIAYLHEARLAGDIVTMTGEDRCNIPASDSVSLAELEARVDAAEATQHLRGRRLPEAIARAEHAIALAPQLDELYVQLAVIHVAAGQRHKAARTLATLAARNPVWVHLQLQERPDLAGLAREPQLAALRVARPATIDLAKPALLVDRSGRFLAVAVEAHGWGSGDTVMRVEIVELATGRIVATIPRVIWSPEIQPTSPAIAAKARKRQHQVERWLADLGFAGVATEAAVVTRGADDATVMTFAKAQLIVTTAGQILRDTTVLGERPVMGGRADDASWLPAQRVVVFRWSRRVAEGCDARAGEGIAIAKVRR